MSEEEHTSPSPEERRKIGSTLERARAEKGLSLEEVEQATKIRKRYLVGLEQEDYGVLPDAVYVQGFLKTYANYLGLDGEEMSQEFRSSRRPRRERQLNYSIPPRSDFEQPLVNPGGVSGARRPRVSDGTIITIIVAALVLALVIGGLYFIGRGSQASLESGPPKPVQAPAGTTTQEDGEEEPAVDTSDPETTQEPDTTVETTSEAGETLRVEVRVEERPSWLEIRADGTIAFAKVARPGFLETFEARRKLSVTTGDAGAVRVSVNGQDVGVLGYSGQVLTQDWTLKTEG